MSAPALTLAEGVPLGYALVLRAAADVGVRALAIKGPVLTAQGLRGEHQSVDVDVLVDPAGVEPLRAELERLGWAHDGTYATPGIVPTHSFTHSHPRWPCGVDLHHWFPGFLADPAEVFDVLWDRRTTVEVAHHGVPATDVVAGAAVAALHYLRGVHRAASLDDLAERVRTSWTPSQRDDLAVLAANTGSTEPLRPFLDAVGVVPRPPTRAVVKPLAQWELPSELGTTSLVPWLMGLRETPWWRRPAFVWRALWLRESNFKALHSTRSLSRAELRRARRARLVRAARGLRQGVADYRRLRRR
ncbi:hypothetical protein GCM10023340_19990 [Nocardioides marinquilinus]|uniref:Nucleotidyltransferase family protein n=1 Tax=Nocardioides marinquilinus TaxID=1210400 RepID=A0ABP9PJ80_9ACTN